MTKNLPASITTLDLLKTFAVVIMLIDHIGYYLFPEMVELRIIGRVGFPVWFFLVGYARGREIGPILLGGALILLAANFVVGMALIPLNALFTIILMRLMMDRLAAITFVSLESLLIGSLTLAVMIIPTSLLTEYGSMALIAGLFGYVVRNRPALGSGAGSQGGRAALPFYFMILTLVTFVASQQFNFAFTPLQSAAVATGTLPVLLLLLFLKVVELPRVTAAMPAFAAAIFRFGGRRTLEIYVAHLLILKVAMAVLFPEHLDWFDLRFAEWLPEDGGATP